MEQLKRKCQEEASKEKMEENKTAAEREVRIAELMAANKVRTYISIVRGRWQGFFSVYWEG